uniref:DocCel5: Type I dockerin repeat domain from A. cellulolyticus family 5 endoglucanase WP_010249057 S51I, L52N mutant n=1 Tax=Acetivibrio cellulolyticus TaxID=35830 RepID=A0A2R2JFJ7_9FIRM|nr:Chain B, DocCel5: Type I dockerin repeat domain from A. cellulolyticus family 5 endoglucanase WP_010249057 S51I, L52N mutant [Acetivibrio cellulolyticus]
KPGDVDGNGSINSIDFALMRNYLLGNLKDFPAEDDIKAGDLNGDKSININDFAIMRMYLLGMITKF